VNPNLFSYVWQHSKREQIAILILIVASLPFYWLSLDVPKRIVNEALQGEAFTEGSTTAKLFEVSFDLPAFLGGGTAHIFDGFDFNQIQYLLALSFLFLFFVLVNGAFRYKINIDKGVLAERMLRRLRFDLFARLMRFRPEDIRQVKPAEAATMINNEVEPIGGFIGDAFVWPAFLGTQALTALLFIMMQSFWLGLVAMAIVLVQAFIIPALRRKQLEYARKRQIAARQLAGRIGEMVDGAPLIQGHGVSDYSQAEVSGRLAYLFKIRVALYNRKYAVKYLNTLLSQITPFFFYAIGGYFALTGSLDIGQLVAVIAAYKDLPPPVKELIDWDQRRADVTIKYQQVISQFSAEKLQPEITGDEAVKVADDAPLQFDGVRVLDQRSSPLLDAVNMTIERPSHVAVVGPPGSGRDIFMRLLGRQITDFEGKLRIGDHELNGLSNVAAGRFMAYAPPEPFLFPGPLRDNIAFPLKRRQPAHGKTLTLEERKDIVEAQRSGNPTINADADWIDYDAAGVASDKELDLALLKALRTVGLEDTIYEFGLLGTLPKDTDADLLKRFVDARRVVRQRLRDHNLLDVVEPFDPERFNRNASLGKNLVFGVVAGERLSARGLSCDRFVRSIIGAEGLEKPLVEMGLAIAQTTIETFADLPPGHQLFERYALIQSSELDEFAEIIEKANARDAGMRMSRTDYERLIDLALQYSEPRHRLSLIDPVLEQRILRARKSFIQYLPQDYAEEIEFYDPQHFIHAAAIRDNLLFGRVSFDVANADRQVADVLQDTLTDLGLLETVYKLGLEYDVGPAGKLLFAPQRVAINLARCLVKNPDLLVIDASLSDFSAGEAESMVRNLQQAMQEKTLIMAFGDRQHTEGFDRVIEFDGVRVSDYGLTQVARNTAERVMEPSK